MKNKFTTQIEFTTVAFNKTEVYIEQKEEETTALTTIVAVTTMHALDATTSQIQDRQDIFSVRFNDKMHKDDNDLETNKTELIITDTTPMDNDKINEENNYMTPSLDIETTTLSDKLATHEMKDMIEIKLVSDHGDHIIVKTISSTDQDLENYSTEGAPEPDPDATTRAEEKTGRSLEDERGALIEMKELQELKTGEEINFQAVYRSEGFTCRIFGMNFLLIMLMISIHLI